MLEIMTNLITLAMTLVATNTVELKTNETEHASAPDVPSNCNLSIFYIPQSQRDKWVRTCVSEERTLSFRWEGEVRTITKSIPLSTNTVHLRIKEDWEVVK